MLIFYLGHFQKKLGLYDDFIKIYRRGTEADFRENLSNTFYFLKRTSESLKQDFSILFSDHESQYFGKLNKIQVFIILKNIVLK